MDKNHDFLESLIKDSQKNTEILLELYFRTVHEKVYNEEILNLLSDVSKNMVELQTKINFQLEILKQH